MKIKDAVFVYRLSGGDRLSWHGRYHAHGAGEFEIHFFLEGSGSFLCNQTQYPVSAGRLFLTGPREFHSILPDAVASPLSWYAIIFTLEAGADSPGSVSSETSLLHALESCLSERRTVLSIDNNFRFQFEDLLRLARSADSSLQESARHLLISFLYRWFGHSVSSFTSLQSISKLDSDAENPASPGASGRSDVRDGGRTNRMHVEKALALMEKSVRENLKVEEIAWKLGLSDEHFIRVFRQEVRMTPHQYFTRLKVEGASGLLMSTDKTVGEISEWFGFENQFHFSRIFKKCTGMSPVDYRHTYLQTVDFT